MDLPRDIDLYLKESIDDSLGLPVSLLTLESKLRASEESQRLLRQQRLCLLSKLKEKDQMIDRIKVCFSIFLINSLLVFVIIGSQNRSLEFSS